MKTGNRESGRQARTAIGLTLFGVLLLLLLAGCAQEQGDRPMGEGYIGSSSPSLRDRLGPGSAVVAALKPGDKVVILQKRRRWARVRVNGKQEGWIDDRNIIAPEEFGKFQGVVQASAAKISQGDARARGTVNLHLEPDRKSPSFFQLAEGEACEVLELRATPKPLPPGSVPPPSEEPGSGQPGKPGAAPAPAATPGQPAAKPAQAKPQPPAAGDKLPRGKKAKGQKKDKRAKESGPAMEDWYLVRGKAKAGWAVARFVEMAIPDDVAQYAEGQPIVAWHVLDTVKDGDQQKPQYVWATSGEVGSAYDFTGIRVFVWNTNHHRYETSYRERNIRGTYPLTVSKIELKDGRYPAFTVVSADAAGNKTSRQLVLFGNVVRRREQLQ